MKPVALMLCLFVCAAHSAHADSRSVSYSVWSISDRTVILRFLVPATEAARLSGSDIPVLTSSKLAEYVLRHVGVDAAGNACTAIDQGYDIGQVDPLAVGAQLYGFEIVFRCPAATPLLLHNTALFDRTPSHVNFARVQLAGSFSEQLFTQGRQTLRIDDATRLDGAGFGRYMRLGASHLLHSAAQLCFLLASILLIKRRQDALRLLGGLAFGYALSILFNTLGWVITHATYADASIGLLVALQASTFIAAQSSRPQWVVRGAVGICALLAGVAAVASASAAVLLPLGGAFLAGGVLTLLFKSEGRVPWAAGATLLGLMDGALLPSMLTPLALAARTVAPMQIGYDAGILLMDAALLVAMLVVLTELARRRPRLDRPLAADLSAAALSGMGVFWLVRGLFA